jgi:hypothetical protein
MSNDIGDDLMVEQEPIEWFFQTRNQSRYSHADVLALGDQRLPPATVQNWCNRELLKPKIVSGKRKYDALQVAQVVLAQPLVIELHASPSAGTHAVINMLYVLKHKFNNGELSPADVKHHIFVFKDLTGDPLVFDTRKSAHEILQLDDVVVLLHGRLLDRLARDLRQIVESKKAKKKAA